jgi:ribosomal protein L21E
MAVHVNYKGQTITFNEEKETWFNDTVGEKKSLKAAKAAIDDVSRKDRQLGVKVLRIERSFKRGDEIMSVQETTVSILCEPHPTYRGNPGEVTECWITDGKTRSRASIRDLYPLNARNDLEAWLDLNKKAAKAAQIARKFHDDIEAYNADTILLASKENTT